MCVSIVEYILLYFLLEIFLCQFEIFINLKSD